MSEFGQAPSPTNHRDHNHQSNHPHLIIITSPSQAVFNHTPHLGTLSGLNFEKDSLYLTYLPLRYIVPTSLLILCVSSVFFYRTPSHSNLSTKVCARLLSSTISSHHLQRLRTVSTPIQYYHPPHSTLLTSLFIIPASINIH